jgi:hypothetical protein
MAAHGHSGLPTQIGGALPAPLPPAAPLPGAGGASDTQIAKTAEQHLMAAVQAIKDPALKATLSTAIAALHKYLAQDEKEHQQALQGKFSPRIMAKASSGGQ